MPLAGHAVGCQDPFSRPELTSDQRALLRALQRDTSPIPELNLRGADRHEALDRLIARAAQHRLMGHPYLRVITGKGISSARQPVLKRLTLAWCARELGVSVRRFAPEIDAHGEFGTIIVELVRHRAPLGLSGR